MNLCQLFIQKGELSPFTGYDYRSWQARIPSVSREFIISVIAGPHAYCSPREFKENAEYESVELSIVTKEGFWATEEQASPVFPIIGEGEYEIEHGGFSSVFINIPVEHVFKVVDAL